MADWSEKWYKKKFQNLEAEPSSQNWEEISAQMDEWPSHWYKSNVEDLKLKPKADLWDRISAEIIPPSVGISFNPGFYIRSTIAVFIFLFIPLTITQWDNEKTSFASQVNDHNVANSEANPLNNTEVKNNVEEKNLLSENNLPEENKNTANQLNSSITQKNTSNKSTKLSNSSNLITDESNVNDVNSTNQNKNTQNTPFPSDEVYEDDLTNTNSDIIEEGKGQESEQEKELELINTLFSVPINRKTVEQNIAKNIIEIPEKKLKPSNNWMIGAQLRPQVSTLLNPITLSAMRGSESIQMAPGINVTYALAISRKINNYTFIDAGIEMNNRRTHRYTKSSFEMESDKTLDLNYLTLEVTHRKKSKSIFSQNPRLSFSTIKGIYGSYLVASNEVMGSDEGIELKDGFRNFDLGISLGLEVSMHVQPNVEIYSGIKTQIGAMSIFKGTEFVPHDFFFNSTSSTGLFIGLRKFF